MEEKKKRGGREEEEEKRNDLILLTIFCFLKNCSFTFFISHINGIEGWCRQPGSGKRLWSSRRGGFAGKRSREKKT